MTSHVGVWAALPSLPIILTPRLRGIVSCLNKSPLEEESFLLGTAQSWSDSLGACSTWLSGGRLQSQV